MDLSKYPNNCKDSYVEPFEESTCGYQSTPENKREIEFTGSDTSFKVSNLQGAKSCEGEVCEYSGSCVKMRRAPVAENRFHALRGWSRYLASIFKIGSFTECKTMWVMEDGVQNSRDKPTAGIDVRNWGDISGIKTLEDSLNHFNLYGSFQKLEKSLEDAKRNKKSKKEHEQHLKLFDKEVQKLCLEFHPDRVCNRGGSGQELQNAEKLQSALNAMRTVLKVLTMSFLEDIDFDFDYKYGYFTQLNIDLLGNENEIKYQINRVLCKISELSEIKRMNIVGEIRKFLVEAQRSVKCCLEGNRNDFKKYRNYALYHLGKTIEGYNKLEKICYEIHEECIDEGKDNMGTDVRNIARQSSKESFILCNLLRFAKDSGKGKFKIFPVNETMDDYHILPFIYYVNILSICNLILENSRSWSLRTRHANPIFEKEERPLLRQAYYLASYIYDQNQYTLKVTEIMGMQNRAIDVEDVKKKLKDILGKIVDIFKKEFSVDAYKEGKSNRTQLMEKLLEVMADFEEKAKTLREQMIQYEVGSEENCEKHHRMKGEEKETEKQFTESVLNCTENRKENIAEDIREIRNQSEENRKKLDEILKKEKEIEEKFKEILEQNKKKFEKKLSEIILSSKQHQNSSFENESGENKEKSVQNRKSDKCEEGFDPIEKIRAQLTESFAEKKQNLAENEIHDKCRKVDNVEKKGDAEFERDLEKNFHWNTKVSEHCSETKQNTAENEE